MKNKSLSRDYPLSETKMTDDENKKTSSDTKSNVVNMKKQANSIIIDPEYERQEKARKHLLPASSNVSSR
jgi:hypothetical protein